jgi:methionine synthase II (cobalamin-independent)
MRLIVIGGDAAGMSAAAQARRKRGPGELEILAFELGRFVSYSACGIPYWIGGVVDGPDAATGLRTVTEAVDVPVVVHCCAPDMPLQVIRDSRAAAVAFDLSLIKDLDPVGEAIEAGLGLFVGAAPTRPVAGRKPEAKEIAERVEKLWQRLGFPAARLPRQVVITPACGLAGAPVPYVRALLKACHEAGRRISEV